MLRELLTVGILWLDLISRSRGRNGIAEQFFEVAFCNIKTALTWKLEVAGCNIKTDIVDSPP